jgi:hypothetical protein
MAYVNPNYKSGKAFKEAVGRGVIHRPYNPSGMFPQRQNGTETIEGPHYPQPHRWYVGVVLADGIVVKAGSVRLGSQPVVPADVPVAAEAPARG